MSKCRYFAADFFTNFNLIVILEFKIASKTSEIDKKKVEGLNQIHDREYAKFYDTEKRKVVTAVLVVDDQERSISL